jgi:hypothetical protein
MARRDGPERGAVRRWVQQALRQFGYQLVRNTQPPRSLGTLDDDATPLPAAFTERLRRDHPRLRELTERYARCGLPMFRQTWWTPDYVQQTLDLRRFRGDNAYVWQKRHLAEGLRQRYFLYALDVAGRDRLGLFDRLREDGAFGCWVHRYRRFPALSRDLLDSVNELNFLERHAGLSRGADTAVLDIGAGYGRLAHRALEAFADLRAWWCIDAVAESTFVSEAYLDYRGCGPRARVVPGDELAALDGMRFDLAVNVHSFSEMSLAAIEGWLAVLGRLRVPRLMIVPNDAEALLSMEGDGTRHDFAGALAAHGYALAATEPAIQDPDTRELVGVTDQMFLFERRP